ncbi:MAG: hypothetical protein ACR2QF_02785 [Geminicoccaceae bacterium]
MTELPPSVFQRRYPDKTPISDIAPRFRCRNCGKLGTRFWDAWQINRNV